MDKNNVESFIFEHLYDFIDYQYSHPNMSTMEVVHELEFKKRVDYECPVEYHSIDDVPCCPYCGAGFDLEVLSDGEVCMHCGYTCKNVAAPERRRPPYKPEYHWRERIVQYHMGETSIEANKLEAICERGKELDAEETGAWTWSKLQIRKVLRSVMQTYQAYLARIYFRRWQQAAKVHKNRGQVLIYKTTRSTIPLRSILPSKAYYDFPRTLLPFRIQAMHIPTRKYLERWLQIRRAMIGERPPLWSPFQVRALERMFTRFKTCFYTRVVDKRKRHNLPNYNEMFQYFLSILGLKKSIPYFPGLATKHRRDICHGFINQVKKHIDFKAMANEKVYT